MSLVERCKTKYQKRKVLYNLAGVMSPDRFDEWFPPTSYGHGMVMTDGN